MLLHIYLLSVACNPNLDYSKNALMDYLTCGFAGVDVFFVISGFLMTSLISRDLRSNSLSLTRFYVARANRIVPALAVLCFTLLIMGFFFISPLDYKSLGRHITSSIGFFSNVIYYRESEYFDASSRSKWLLHTWSLSVEWQFYLFYPVLLSFIRKNYSLAKLRISLLSFLISFPKEPN